MNRFSVSGLIAGLIFAIPAFAAPVSASSAAPFAADGASAAEFSYSDLQEEFAMWGYKTKENYDIAIRLVGPEFVGTRVSSFDVPMFAAEGVGEISVWLSKELTLESKVNVPDICSVDASIVNDRLHVDFAEPYTITEEGVYVGYSFKITETGAQAQNSPVALTYGKNPNGLFVHTNRSQIKWIDKSSSLGGISRISVGLEGDFPAVGMRFSYPDEMNIYVGEDSLEIPVTVYNSGTDPVSSMTFEVAYEGGTHLAEINFAEPKDIQIFRGFDYKVSVPSFLQLGMNYPQIRLTQINGEPNPYCEAEPAPIAIYSYDEAPKKRPLLEEYTGLWCGWCPRGYVSLERMAKEYEDFIGVAIHSGDDMQVLPGAQFPNEADGLPIAWSDRTDKIDPEYTIVNYTWEKAAKEFAPVEIEVATEELAEDQVKALAKVRFVRPALHDYAIFFYLLGHGMSYNSWLQTNYFSGRDPELYPGMDRFINYPEKVPGLVFNDVLVAFTDPKGLEGSLPSAGEIVAGEWIESEYTFDAKDIMSLQDFNLSMVTKGYSVVAGVVDQTTGKVVNAAKAWVGDFNSVESLVSESEVQAREYFDLQGCRVSPSTRGMIIEKLVLTDGTVKARKVMR